MALQTPTTHKTSLFQPFRRPVYYEDIYTTPDAGEDDEGPQDRCETDSDSDGEDRTADRSSKHLFMGGLVTKVNRNGSASRKRRIPMADASLDIDGDSQGYNITPRTNANQSMPAFTPRKLVAKKFGMFGGYLPDESKNERTLESTPPEALEPEESLMSGGLGTPGRSDRVVADVEENVDDLNGLIRDTPSKRSRLSGRRLRPRYPPTQLPTSQKLIDKHSKWTARRSERLAELQQTGGSDSRRPDHGAEVDAERVKDFTNRAAFVLLEDDDINQGEYISI